MMGDQEVLRVGDRMRWSFDLMKSIIVDDQDMFDVIVDKIVAESDGSKTVWMRKLNIEAKVP